MRRQHDVGQAEKRIVPRRGLGLLNVEAGAGKAAGQQGGGKRGFIDEAAAGG